MSLAAVAVGVALALDVLVGEPPTRLHPVAWFGRPVGWLNRSWRRPRLAGAVGTVALPLLAAAAVAGVVAVAGWWRPLAGAAVGGIALFVTVSLRRLLAVAGEVNALVDTDIDEARERLRALAGRDASDLSPGQIRSAVVESLTENLADGFVAPLGWFAVVAAVAGWAFGAVPTLALAAGAAAWVKAVNTMDSMLGYRERPTGWAPARLDDAVMWWPARACAVVLAAVARSPATLVRAREWLDAVPSPNSGWPMGVAAAALAVRLEKPGVYVLAPAAALPTAADVTAARRLCGLAGALAAVTAGVVAW